ncbi:MAG: hypothetical protein HY508_09035 [Acidobacteria bacterium]|nr:hypothetical protein [Acidobacteriota bacterium]
MPFCSYQFGHNEGILSKLAAVSTKLLGLMAGHWPRSGQSPQRKAGGLALAGMACLILRNV